MKNILIATDCYLPRWDGIARFLSELIPPLTEKFTITVIAPDFEGQSVPDERIKMIRIKTYNFQIGDYRPPKIKANLIMKEVLENDIIFAQTVGPIGATAIRYGKKNNKKVVSYVHSLEWELFAKSISDKKAVQSSVHHITKRFVKRVYSKCDLLLVPSPAVADVVKSIGISTKTETAKLGVDTKKFSPSRKKPGIRITIGYAGRIGREKDIPTLLKAWKIIREKRDDTDLMIVGEGITSYDDEIKALGVIRVGSTNNMAEYLKKMDLYVLTSLTETTSLSTLEAMSCGVPAIVTGTGETKIYVKEGRTGWKFQRGNHEELASKILNIIKDRKRMARVGKAARQMVIRDYNWKLTVAKITEVFENI